MADLTEDVTLLAHIRAEDDASDQVAQVESGFQGLRSTIEDMASGLADAFEATRSVIGGVSGALTAGYYSATESSLHYAEAVAKVEFLTGQSAQTSSALISAFRAFGFTTDEATLTVQRLTSRLGAIDQAFQSTGKISATQTQQLKEMGLTVKQLTDAHGNLNQLLPSIIDHMKGMSDPLERDRLAMQLFGRNFAALAPLIREGGAAFAAAQGDAKKFGVELSDAQVNAFETYSSAIETAKEAVQGFVLQFGVYALPYFQKGEDLIKRIALWWHNLNPEIRDSVVHITSMVAVFGGLVGGGELLGKVIDQFKGFPVIGDLLRTVIGPLALLLDYIGPLIAGFLFLQHLFQTNAQAAALMTPVIDMAKLVFKEFLNLLDTLRDVWATITSDAMPKGQASFANLAKTVRDDLLGALTTLGVWLVEAQTWIADHRFQIEQWAAKIEELAGQIGKFLTDTLAPFMTSTGGLKDFILNDLLPALAQIVWPVVDPALQAAWGWLKDNGTTVGQTLKDIAIGYAAIKTVGTLSAAITNVYELAGAFRAAQMEEGTVIALSRVLGIEAAVNAAKTAAAWVASAAASLAAWVADAAETVAIWIMLAAESVVNAVKAGVAWAFSADAAFTAWTVAGQKMILMWIKTAAAAVVNAAKAAAAWVWEGVVADTATTVSAARMAAAWVASSAVAVASAARAAAGWLIANGAMLVVRAATIAWTAVQWLLNVALSANPIALIVIAIAALVVGIIWAYNNVGWFRDAVNRAWVALQVLGAWITGTLLPALGSFFSWLGTTARGIVDGLGSAFSGLGTTVQNIWQGIAATVRTYVNQIIGMIDGFIRGVNNITIPSWVPGVGGQHSNIPQIPYLYTGAVVTQPTLAMVGDRGTEVVATLTQAVQAGMRAAQNIGGGNGQPIIIEFHVDGRVIERKIAKVSGNRLRLQGATTGSGA